MREKELSFVIPTHRLREVGETIEQYDEHFWRNGHSVRIVVFDDSTPTNQQKYYPLLEQTHTPGIALRRSSGEGAISRLSELKAPGQAAGRAGKEPVPSELRRQPEF